MAHDDAHSDTEIDAFLEAAGAAGDADGPEVDVVAIGRWRAGELTDDEAAAVERQLVDDPAGRAFAMGLGAEVETELVHWAVEQMPRPTTTLSSPSSWSPRQWAPRQWAPHLALAAAVVIGVGIWRWGPGPEGARAYTPATFQVLAPIGPDGAFGVTRGDGDGAREISAGQLLQVTIAPTPGAERGTPWLGVFGARGGGGLQWLRAPIQPDATGHFHARFAATALFADHTGPWTLHLVIVQDPTLLARLRGVAPKEARARIEGVWQAHEMVYLAGPL